MNIAALLVGFQGEMLPKLNEVSVLAKPYQMPYHTMLNSIIVAKVV